MPILSFVTPVPLHRDVIDAPRPVGARPTLLDQHQTMCVVVTEIAEGEAQNLVRTLRRRGTARVVVLARRALPGEICALLEGGLRGAVSGSSGVVTIDPPTPAPNRPELSAREIGVLSHVAEGRSNRVIGVELGLSALTVKSHLARISRKLGTGDRAELVAIAIRAGLLG